MCPICYNARVYFRNETDRRTSFMICSHRLHYASLTYPQGMSEWINGKVYEIFDGLESHYIRSQNITMQAYIEYLNLSPILLDNVKNYLRLREDNENNP